LTQTLGRELIKPILFDFLIFGGFFAMFWVYNVYHAIELVDIAFRNFALLALVASTSLFLLKSRRNFQTFSIVCSVAFSIVLFTVDLDNSLLTFFWDELGVETLIIMPNILGFPPIDFVMLGLLAVIFTLKSVLSCMATCITKRLCSYLIQ